MEELISKSQKKLYAAFVQDVGISLTKLTAFALETIPLADGLRSALFEAKTIKSHEGSRRHAQRIGKLMRRADLAAIFACCDDLYAQGKIEPHLFKELSQWREQQKTMAVPVLKEPGAKRPRRQLYLAEPLPVKATQRVQYKR